MLALGIVVATAVVAYAELVDMVGRDARLRNLVDDVALGVIAMGAVHARGVRRGAENRALDRLVHALVRAERSDERIDGKARHERHRGLGHKDAGHLLHRHVLCHEHGEHLVRSAQKHRHERAERHHAAGVERGRHGRESALREHAEDSAEGGTGRTGTTDGAVHARGRGMLDRLERDIGDKEKRHERERVLARVEQDIDDKVHKDRVLSSYRARMLCPSARTAIVAFSMGRYRTI